MNTTTGGTKTYKQQQMKAKHDINKLKQKIKQTIKATNERKAWKQTK